MSWVRPSLSEEVKVSWNRMDKAGGQGMHKWRLG